MAPVKPLPLRITATVAASHHADKFVGCKGDESRNVNPEPSEGSRDQVITRSVLLHATDESFGTFSLIYTSRNIIGHTVYSYLTSRWQRGLIFSVLFLLVLLLVPLHIKWPPRLAAIEARWNIFRLKVGQNNQIFFAALVGIIFFMADFDSSRLSLYASEVVQQLAFWYLIIPASGLGNIYTRLSERNNVLIWVQIVLQQSIKAVEWEVLDTHWPNSHSLAEFRSIESDLHLSSNLMMTGLDLPPLTFVMYISPLHKLCTIPPHAWTGFQSFNDEWFVASTSTTNPFKIGALLAALCWIGIVCYLCRTMTHKNATKRPQLGVSSKDIRAIPRSIMLGVSLLGVSLLYIALQALCWRMGIAAYTAPDAMLCTLGYAPTLLVFWFHLVQERSHDDTHAVGAEDVTNDRTRVYQVAEHLWNGYSPSVDDEEKSPAIMTLEESKRYRQDILKRWSQAAEGEKKTVEAKAKDERLSVQLAQGAPTSPSARMVRSPNCTPPPPKGQVSPRSPGSTSDIYKLSAKTAGLPQLPIAEEFARRRRKVPELIGPEVRFRESHDM
jgi:hypothetical protein